MSEEIVNGIDVSECEFYEEMRELPDNLNGGYYIQHCYCGLQGDNYCICNKNPNCYFKQLKRLEEECKLLHEAQEQGVEQEEELERLERERDFWCKKSGELEDFVDKQVKDIDRLEQENKELKEQLNLYMSQYEIKIPNKYRQALEEIKIVIDEVLK